MHEVMRLYPYYPNYQLVAMFPNMTESMLRQAASANGVKKNLRQDVVIYELWEGSVLLTTGTMSEIAKELGIKVSGVKEYIYRHDRNSSRRLHKVGNVAEREGLFRVNNHKRFKGHVPIL